MRRILVYFVFLLGTVLSHAQGLGDYMEINGVPGFVFYLDETGEHGMVMSFCAMSEKEKKQYDKHKMKAAKKGGILIDDIPNCSSDKLIIERAKDFLKKRGKIYPELSDKLSEDGEENTAVILEFCEEKDLPVKEYFPEYNWVSNLGEGWFIPGKNELYKFAEFYLGGVGKDNKIKGLSKFIKRPYELSNNTTVQAQIGLQTFVGILSSSMENGKNGFMGLVHYSNPGGLGAPSDWFEFTDQASIGKAALGLVTLKQSVETLRNIRTCAVHKF